MAERIYIDGVDIYTSFGAYPLSYDGLMAFPAFKNVSEIDWPDEDSKEVDLTAPKLAPAEMTLHIAAPDYISFMDFVYASATREFHFEALGLTKTLRIVGCSNQEAVETLGMVTLLLSEDKPLEGYQYSQPSTALDLSSHRNKLVMDGVDFADYGIVVLEGTNAVKSYPNIKEALVVNTSNIAGVDYDKGATIRKRSRDLSMRLLMKASSLGEFWNNYHALLHNLSAPGERSLVWNNDVEMTAYYQSMSVEEFLPPESSGQHVWFIFHLSFALLSASSPYEVFRAKDGSFILASGGTLNVTKPK